MTGSGFAPEEAVSRSEVFPVRRMVIAPLARQAQLFVRDSGFNPHKCQIVTKQEQLHGYDLSGWEVWFLQRMWPCRTHEDVQRMKEMMAYARFRGADIHRWWT